jgi:ketosteroid isomerase-like protein
MKLTVRDVWVKGLPHDTTIIVRWTNTDALPDGSRYENHGVHIVKMRWGKIVEIDANEDSQAVAEVLKMRAAYGLGGVGRSHRELICEDSYESCRENL